MAQGSPNVPTRLQVLEVLDRLEAITASATKLPLTRRAVINPAELQELIAKLRHVLPSEITEAQQIIQNKESVLSKAQAEAKHLRESAEQASLQRISETQIVREAHRTADEVESEARRRAQETLQKAEAQARSRMNEADAYAADVLRRLEEELSALLATAHRGVEMLQGGTPLQDPSA